MAADRRVLIIGLVAMLVLVGVGVGSAALFATSACGDIDPRPATPGTAGDDIASVLGDGSDPAAAALGSLVEDLVEAFGPLTGVVDVTGATSVVEFGGAPAALGAVTTVLGPDGATPRAVASFEEPSQVVGDGDRLYSLALINPLTGQVDALVPLDAELEPGTCVDTAVIGEPFAFHLDAGGGELLLFRIEEDSDTPQLELRDAIDGRRWVADLDVPVAPPGILAERVAAALGDELVVASRRVIPGEEAPAIVAVGRDDGAERWRVLPATILERDGSDEPRWLEVAGVGADLAVVTVAMEPDRERATLVAVDLADGAVRWRADPGDGPVDVRDVQVGPGQVWVAWQDDGEVVATSLDVRDGARLGAERLVGEGVRIRGEHALTSDELVRLEGAGRAARVAEVGAPWRLRDLLVSEQGSAAVLVDGPDRSLLLRFG